MKIWRVFILLSLVNVVVLAFGCGSYYPYGEAIRFSLIHPMDMGIKGYNEFNYSANLYYRIWENETTDTDSAWDESIHQNLVLWQNRYKPKFSELELYKAIYKLEHIDTESIASNAFVRFLFKHKFYETIAYLNFAKKIEALNMLFADPWERGYGASIEKRTELLNEIDNRIKNLHDTELKQRYAFLAIRLAFYNFDYNRVQEIYDIAFSGTKKKKIIDYWAMHYYALSLKEGPHKNFYLAQVFANAPDKRLAVYNWYSKKIPIEQVLSYSKSNKEKAAIILLYNVQNLDKGLNTLKSMYTLTPGNESLDFLLMREINKLENWIYTPYYSAFNPSFDYREETDDSYSGLMHRIVKDKNYARECLAFVKQVNIKRVKNHLVWTIALAYLYHMSDDNNNALATLKGALRLPHTAAQKNQIEVLEAKIKVAALPSINCSIPKSIQSVLMKQCDLKNEKFLFAVARELEYKGNSTDAAYLFSKIENVYEWENEGCNNAYWRARAQQNTLYADFYENYFFYLDAAYTPQQIEKLVDDVNEASDDEFDTWKKSNIKSNIDRIYDLLGTLYLRKNQLHKALYAFKQVNDTLWSSDYYPYKTYLNEDPFDITVNPSEKSSHKAFKPNVKPIIIEKMIAQLDSANNPKNPNRDVNYYLLANAYFNATYFGHSWLLKRYYWSCNIYETHLEDDPDYFNCLLAKQYYGEAYKTAKTKEFAALCLRMIARMESFKIMHEEVLRNDNESNSSNTNYYFKLLKKRYPDHYDYLLDNCYSFQQYFEHRIDS